MKTLRLNGLSGSHPLGAMAAFGLLRILSLEKPFGIAKLAWVFDGDWRAELHCANEFGEQQLVAYLIQRQPRRVTAPWLDWHDDIKSSVPMFRGEWLKVVAGYGEQITDHDENTLFELNEHAAFLTGFGSEVVLAKSKPEVKPTGFHMTAGQQRFLKNVKELASSLDPNQRSSKRQKESERLEELQDAYLTAIRGPWTYKDSFHSLGWDPATEGLYALSDRSPSDAGPTSVRAAVWLAFESLPLFPAIPVSNVLHTTGFDRSGQHLRWPIWDDAISVETLRCLLSHPELHQQPPESNQLGNRGVRVVMTCPCVRDANGRGTLRNAIGVSCEENTLEKENRNG
ncbi:type I-G CRISPR-associated protein, Cas3-extension family [Allorhodopirellula solitaria]|uniref:Uncharacterized protein n=1 Tax=Allorhodopirellula solitaria TaxID=2527987 RepID=A0A5C5YIY0_9BACT|nr:hypothetical protein [Allorhodopirellula solitaria]TWT74821.1 hypothetical protein CA85_01070 [Allorhodopirellula solitaria]